VTFDHHVLLWLLMLPLVAGLFIAFLGKQHPQVIHWMSLGASLMTVALAILLTVRFAALEIRGDHDPRVVDGKEVPTFRPEFVPGTVDPVNKALRHQTNWELFRLAAPLPEKADASPEEQEYRRRSGAVHFYLGVDGLSIWLVLLTAVLMLPSVLISWVRITERVAEFYAWLLILQTTMMGVFMAFDIVLFYVFFELSLVPLFFLIGVWGGKDKLYAATKFFIYTLTGSLLSLLGIIALVISLYHKTGELTFSIPRLVELMHVQLFTDTAGQGFWLWMQALIFFLLSIGFAVKVPLLPFHTWLPLAHVEAPTAGSVDLPACS